MFVIFTIVFTTLLNQVHAWFLCLQYWYACVSVCLCVSALKGINNQWHFMMWYRPWGLVKTVPQLFNFFIWHLSSLKWMGMTLVTQYIVHTLQSRQSWCHTSHRRKRINYLAVAKRQSASDVRWVGKCTATHL